jgi:hypothetical protein
VRVEHDIKFTLFQYLTHFWLGFVFSKLRNGPHSLLKLQLKIQFLQVVQSVANCIFSASTCKFVCSSVKSKQASRAGGQRSTRRVPFTCFGRFLKSLSQAGSTTVLHKSPREKRRFALFGQKSRAKRLSKAKNLFLSFAEGRLLNAGKRENITTHFTLWRTLRHK